MPAFDIVLVNKKVIKARINLIDIAVHLVMNIPTYEQTILF